MSSAAKITNRSARVLVLAPQCGDTALIGEVLRSADIYAEDCANLAHLTQRIREGAGAAVMTEEVLADGGADFAIMLREQPSWSDFPIILLGGQQQLTMKSEWLPSASLLPRPLQPEILLSLVRVALRSRQRQYQLQAHLEAQKRRAAEVLEGIFDGYMAVDWQWHCLYVNSRGAELLNYRQADLIGVPILDVLPHWTESGLKQKVQAVLDGGPPFSSEERCPINGKWFDVRFSRSPDGLSIFYSDITARKESEAHLRLLVNELSHRVKNTLAVIQTIADQTLRDSDQIGPFRDAFIGRLQALAETHTLLTASKWESVDLISLVRQTLGHMDANSGLRVHIAGDIASLTPKASLSIGMTLHELSTNAAKYGALSVENGHVDIIWRVVGDDLVVEWDESGLTGIAPPTRKGFGTKLIHQAVKYDLGGTVDYDYRPSGLRCRLSVPSRSALVR